MNPSHKKSQGKLEILRDEKSENTMYQNLWDAAKAVPEGSL